ncbi:MAG: PASTA domain-containing protein [Gammaproteobacteria bacterium]|nr:PASTA domain-containing protein [Gammaproteobacteria bacterium]
MPSSNDCVRDEFPKHLGQLKAERITALGEAAQVQVMMQSLLQHEALRIENKLGKQHPRSRQLKARVQSNLQLVNALELERELTRIEVPEVADDAALVHGRVVDEDERGIEKLVVCLVNDAGAPIRDTGEPTTDASGYHAFTLDPKLVDRLIEEHEAGVFLAVFTPRRRLVHQEPKPLALARGARLLVVVSLNRADLTALPPATVIVPNVVGMAESDALVALERAGLKLGTRSTQVEPKQVGVVLKQTPASGTKVVPGSSVSLAIGVAEQTVKVPNLIRLTLVAAKVKLKAASLKVGTVSGREPTDESIVRKQSPKHDTEVPVGTPVDLSVAPSRG